METEINLTCVYVSFSAVESNVVPPINQSHDFKILNTINRSHDYKRVHTIIQSDSLKYNVSYIWFID